MFFDFEFYKKIKKEYSNFMYTPIGDTVYDYIWKMLLHKTFFFFFNFTKINKFKGNYLTD